MTDEAIYEKEMMTFTDHIHTYFTCITDIYIIPTIKYVAINIM